MQQGLLLTVLTARHFFLPRSYWDVSNLFLAWNVPLVKLGWGQPLPREAMPALPKHFESAAVGHSIHTQWNIERAKSTDPSLRSALWALYKNKILVGSAVAVTQGTVRLLLWFIVGIFLFEDNGTGSDRDGSIGPPGICMGVQPGRR